MYQLILTSNATQSAGETFLKSFFALFGGAFLLGFVIPLLIAAAILSSFGIITATIAGEKGYNKFGFFWYGFFFFPIAVGVAILAPPINKEGYAGKTTAEQDKEELAKYAEMYEAGTISWTQFCQKKEEILQREYRK